MYLVLCHLMLKTAMLILNAESLIIPLKQKDFWATEVSKQVFQIEESIFGIALRNSYIVYS